MDRHLRITGWTLAILCGAAPLRAQSHDVHCGDEWYIHGRAAVVSDGDTFRLRLDNGQTVVVRLYGVDSPETEGEHWAAQPWSQEAKEFTYSQVDDNDVTVRLTGQCTYDRLVGEVLIEGRSLNRELVRNGWAWWYRRFALYDRDLELLEDAARQARTGLWQDDDPTAPWNYRMQHTDGP